MFIQEKNGQWLNFFTPTAITVAGIVLASLTVIPIVLIQLFVPILSGDSIIVNIRIGIFSQILGTILVVVFMIPLAKANDVEYSPMSGSNTLKMGLIFCLTLVVVWMSNLIFALLNSALNATPQSSYKGILLTANQITPLNVLTLFGLVSIGAPVFEEYIYRRIFIPLLEKRGMAPLAAISTSGVVFAISHIPNDLLNGNLIYLIQHFWGVLLLGLACGLAYVLTRNVLYPIIIHGVFNGLSFSGYLLSLSESSLIGVFGLLVIGFLVIGLGGWIYTLLNYRNHPEANWVQLIKEKSSIDIIPGFVGVILLFVASLTVLVLGPISVLVVSKNGLLTLITEIAIQIILFISLVWLVLRTKYVGQSTRSNSIDQNVASM